LLEVWLELRRQTETATRSYERQMASDEVQLKINSHANVSG
jgi:hypothetical protein